MYMYINKMDLPPKPAGYKNVNSSAVIICNTPTTQSSCVIV